MSLTMIECACTMALAVALWPARAGETLARVRSKGIVVIQKTRHRYHIPFPILMSNPTDYCEFSLLRRSDAEGELALTDVVFGKMGENSAIASSRRGRARPRPLGLLNLQESLY